MNENAIQKLLRLSNYVRGMADAKENLVLFEAAEELKIASGHICGAGIYGCRGGENCTSDHK